MKNTKKIISFMSRSHALRPNSKTGFKPVLHFSFPRSAWECSPDAPRPTVTVKRVSNPFYISRSHALRGNAARTLRVRLSHNPFYISRSHALRGNAARTLRVRLSHKKLSRLYLVISFPRSAWECGADAPRAIVT